MGIAELLSEPFYEGGATSSAPVATYDVALAGRPYMIDWKSEIPLRHVSIPSLRQQQDTSESPGEHSINPESLWRRFGESWHVGAGQERFDRKDSNEHRFRTSRGLDIWNKWGLSLLPATELRYNDGSSNQRMAVAGDRLYYTQAERIKYTTSMANAGVNITGEPATHATSIVSNGYRVWTAHGTDGVYMTDRTAGATASHITGTVSLLAYVKNRVMAAHGPSIYDVTALAIGTAGALPAALFTHGNTDWNWVGFAESQQFIYAAGYSGDKSLIYSISLVSEGTALGAPSVAGALPEGEVVSGVYGYLGRFLAIGSNKGIRLALVSEGGGLTIGALIPTPNPVKCFEGQEEFIWYGLTGFASDGTGLGRLSTAEFSDIDRLVPAYASDLMAENQTAEVVDVVTFEGRRVFSVAGVGIYAEDATDLVETGYLDTGGINYGILDPKTALYVDLRLDGSSASDASATVSFSTDGGVFTDLVSQTVGNNLTVLVGEQIGSEYELRITLTRDTADATQGISLLSWLLRVQPRPLVTNMIYATILLAPFVADLVDTDIVYNTLDELTFIEETNLSKAVVTFQHSEQSYSVVLEDFEMNIRNLGDGPGEPVGFNGSCTLKLKRV